MKLIFLGKQASGKGTIASMMSQRYGFCHVSTGDLFRNAVQKGGELGEQLSALMNVGKLVPDEMTVKVVTDHIATPDCSKGFILDGFPRDLSQAESFDKVCPIDNVVVLHIEDELAIHRLDGRRQCKQCHAVFNIHPDCAPNPKTEGVCDKCGGELFRRKDDEPEAIAKRLKTYHEKTHPLIEYYRKKDLVLKVDASDNPDAILQRVIEGLGL